MVESLKSLTKIKGREMMPQTASESFDYPRTTKVLDVIEEVVSEQDWAHERRERDFSTQVPGKWCDYVVHFSWIEDMTCLSLSCMLDMRIDPKNIKAVYELIGISNNKISIGFFNVWVEEWTPVFRIVVPMRGQKSVSAEQIQDMLEEALRECERFYPAFNYVIWGNKTPEEALQLAIIDTEGEA